MLSLDMPVVFSDHFESDESAFSAIGKRNKSHVPYSCWGNGSCCGGDWGSKTRDPLSDFLKVISPCFSSQDVGRGDMSCFSQIVILSNIIKTGCTKKIKKKRNSQCGYRRLLSRCTIVIPVVVLRSLAVILLPESTLFYNYPTGYWYMCYWP